MDDEYNPLDYQNLTRNCVQELMSRAPYELPIRTPFDGAGVYALFYRGDLSVYARLRSEDARQPIYVGKAVPPGARRGSPSAIGTHTLFARLRQHQRSIEAVHDLKPPDFWCRYLVVTPLWITMAERFLIEHYRPLWNVYLDGFGNHDPGSGRYAGEATWWDALHPGRTWAERLRPTRSHEDAAARVRDYLDLLEQRPEVIARMVDTALEREARKDDSD